MPRAYSVDLRERSLRAMTSGMPMTEVAQLFDVSRSRLARWKRKAVTGQSLRPGRSSGRRPVIAPEQEADLVTQVHGVPVSAATMSRTLRRVGLSPKRNR